MKKTARTPPVLCKIPRCQWHHIGGTILFQIIYLVRNTVSLKPCASHKNYLAHESYLQMGFKYERTVLKILWLYRYLFTLHFTTTL